MKAVVNKTDAPTVFQPFKLVITFETQDEADLWRKLMSRNLIVPAHLVERKWLTNDESPRLSDMMGDLAYAARGEAV